MQNQVAVAKAEMERQLNQQQEASEKNIHYSARLVSNNHRIQQLQQQIKAQNNKERQLLQVEL